MTERVVFAYSGGLDTSVANGWIAEGTGPDAIVFREAERSSPAVARTCPRTTSTWRRTPRATRSTSRWSRAS